MKTQKPTNNLFKSTVLFFCFLFAHQNLRAQLVAIPDTAFVNWLNANGYSQCINGNQLDTTCAAVMNATRLDCSYTQIVSLEGVQYFKGLQTLIYIDTMPSVSAQFGFLTTLPALPVSLDTLICKMGHLTALPPLPNSLVYLDCSNNSIDSLPALPPSLNFFSCASNQLDSLPFLPFSLTYFSCADNSFIGSFPFLPASLKYFDCSYCHMNFLPPLPASLLFLDCSVNDQIYSLPTLPNSLKHLECKWNQISSFPVLPNSLTYFNCTANYASITSLPPLPASLDTLICSSNKITSLPALPATLKVLWCNSQYGTTPITLPTSLPSSLLDFACGSTQLTSLPPLPSGLRKLDCSSNTMTLTSLPALPSSLRYLACNGNYLLASLPTLPDSLFYLDCSNNRTLTSLPTLPDSMNTLNCSSILNLSCLPILTKITNLDFRATPNITCVPNYGTVTASTPLLNSYPLCDAANSHGCPYVVNQNLVWPGDANADGIANNQDVLAIGIGYGISGFARPNATTNWVGQSSPDWLLQLAGGANLKHVDCNGDAFIDSNDVAAINLNYGLVHLKGGSQGGMAGADLYLEFAQDSFNTGDTVSGSIYLGTTANPVSNIYGIAFSLTYNQNIVDSGSLRIDFTDSWFVPNNNRISIAKDLYAASKIDMGLSRINHNNASGSGKIADVSFVIQDNIDGKDFLVLPLEIQFENVVAIDKDEAAVSLSANGDTLFVKDEISSVRQINQLADVRIFPNPAANEISVLSDFAIMEYSILDLAGKEIMKAASSQTAGMKSVQINISALEAGSYFIQLKGAEQFSICRKIVVLR